jgi:glycosidase
MPFLRSLSLSSLVTLIALGCGAGTDPTGGAGGQGGGPACSPTGDLCPVTFSFPLQNQSSVELRGDFAPGAWEQGIPLEIDAGEWRVTIQVPAGTTVRYKFWINGSEWALDPANPQTVDDGFGSQNNVKNVQCDTLPLCEEVGGGGSGGGVPPGAFDWRSAVMYFVFVDRFRNGDTTNDDPIPNVEAPANYQGGDWAGLLETIESGYFEDLGVNALWLTVPMDNPNAIGLGADGRNYSAYHGYWISDLEKVEEHFGDMALLKQVIDAAHDRGIKVLFDYAMNHVHTSNPLFTDQASYFWPLDFDGKYCVCGDGCSWDGYEGRRCWFRDYLPDWNFQSAEARAASVDNAIWWIKETGVDGYRLDAIKHIETVWVEDLRKRVNDEIDQSKGRFYMVGETFETGNRDVIRQYVGPTLLDGQFDFPLRGAVVEHVLRRSGTMFDLDNFLASNDGYYGEGSIMSTWIGNHDIPRVIQTALDSPWGTWDNGGNSNWVNPPGQPSTRSPYERMLLGFTFIFTTQGVPLVYYGDEIGLAGSGDPDNRRFMQWDGTNEHQDWLRESLKKLGAVRKERTELWAGKRTTVFVSNDVYAYRMTQGAKSTVVVINRGDVAAQAENLPDSAVDALSGDTVTGPTAMIPARTARILPVDP